METPISGADAMTTSREQLIEAKYGEGVEHGLRIDAERERDEARADVEQLSITIRELHQTIAVLERKVREK
jgi:hypothetical protein